jgi:hypothetical protein
MTAFPDIFQPIIRWNGWIVHDESDFYASGENAGPENSEGGIVEENRRLPESASVTNRGDEPVISPKKRHVPT